jgi:hypothetical protein
VAALKLCVYVVQSDVHLPHEHEYVKEQIGQLVDLGFAGLAERSNDHLDGFFSDFLRNFAAASREELAGIACFVGLAPALMYDLF